MQRQLAHRAPCGVAAAPRCARRNTQRPSCAAAVHGWSAAAIEGELASVTGAKLYTQRWQPAGAPRATLVFVHGCCDHVGRYSHVFGRLAAGGVAVTAFDAVGHGRSGDHPTRGRYNVHRFDELVDDAERVAAHALAAAARDAAASGASAPPPAFLMGQSLGGLVACNVALRDQARWARGGLVLMSAAVDVKRTPTLRAQALAGSLLSALLPDAAIVPAAPTERLSRSAEARAAHAADPLVPHHGKLKCRVSFESMRAFAALQPRYGSIAVPLLAMHGTANSIASLEAVRRLVDAAASDDKALLTWPDAFHELFHEPEREAVIDALLAWITRRAAEAAAK